jgi:hypothetical protein
MFRLRYFSKARTEILGDTLLKALAILPAGSAHVKMKLVGSEKICRKPTARIPTGERLRYFGAVANV